MCKCFVHFLGFIFSLFQRRQLNRVKLQRDLAQKIVTGSWEIEYAIKRHKRINEEEVKGKQDILDSKLKPKGHLLLKKK